MYVYGSLVTGDYSPAASDIEVVVLVQRDPDEAMTRELTELHTALARGRAVRAMAAAGHQAGPACRMKFSGQTMEFRTRQ